MSDARENKKSSKKRKSLASDGSPSKKQKKKISDTVQLHEEEDFPRGGSNTLTPLEVRQIKNEAEKDILFGASVSNSEKKGKAKKKVQKKKGLNEAKDGTVSFDIQSGNVESLTFKNIAKGDLLLGVIQEIYEFELLVSLPNNLTGSVNISNINKAFTSQLEAVTENESCEHEDSIGLHKFFTVGLMVKCVVILTDNTKQGHSKIKLSIDPVEVNNSLTANTLFPNMVITGYVTSIEDHGYSVSLGIDGVPGFLPKANVQDDLSIGQIVDCLVVSVNANRKLVQLQCDKNKIKTVLTKQSDKVVFSSLLPGMLVKSSVKEVNTFGVLVDFLGGFSGSISLLHLEDLGGDGEALDETYTVKTKMLSRIMFVRPSTKTAGLSTLPKVIDYEPFGLSDVSIGDVIEEAMVTRRDKGKGLLLKLTDTISGYAHISRLSDEHVTKIDKKFKPGTSQRCRILNFNTLVGLALVTLQESIIAEPFIRYQDIKPGDIITGTVKSFLSSGMLVALSDHIRGYCAILHYADVPLKNPEKKLYEGKKVKCRVLFVDAERKRLHLTNKKTLVNSELPAITNYCDVKVGTKAQGYITAIRDYGCIMHFYNNVHGIVRKNELGLKASENPREAFYVGQVAICVVVSCVPDTQRLALSFNLSAKPYSKTPLLGTLVKVDVIAKSDAGLDVQITPSNTPAFVPQLHLSDHQDHCSALLEMFAPSSDENAELKSLDNVLCYGRSKDKSIIVTRRQSLIKMATDGNFVRRFEDLQLGLVLPGFVRQTMPYGIFIEFSPNVFGLAPNSFLSDKYIADGSQYFKIGQPVVAKVIEIHTDRRRFLVSLKPSDCYPEACGAEPTSTHHQLMVDLMKEYLQEREEILEKLPNLRDIVPGSIVPAKVTAVKNYGIIFQLVGGIEGFAPPQLTKGVSAAVDDVCDALVLDYNMEKKQAYLTVDSNTVRQKKKNNSKKSKLKPGQVVPAIIQLVHKEYVVVILPDHSLRTAYVPIKSNINDIEDPVGRFTVGQSCSATIERCVSSKLKHGTIIASVESPKETTFSIKPGDIVTGVVRSIKDLQMNVHLSGGRYHGRVHVTEISDDATEGTSPLTLFKCGENIQVKVLGFRDSKKHNFLPITHRNFSKAVAELSTRPSRLREDDDNNDKAFVDKEATDYKGGEKILCFVKSIKDDIIWMSVSTSVDGRVTLLDVSNDVKVLQNLSTHFKIGVGYHCTVIEADEKHKSLNLSMLDGDIRNGQIVPGRISKIFPNKGILVGLPRKKCGMAFLTDLNDEFKEDPLSEYSVGQLVSCYVLAVGKGGQIDLSTRPSKTDGRTSTGKLVDKDVQCLEDIEEGVIVRGYVKTVSDVGIFISLSRSIAARVQIKNLSHYFVKNWKPLFPVGKLVKGKVLSIDPCSNRIELSLKGKDVGDTDPAPKPERNKKSKSESSKRAHGSSDSENVDDEGLLKKPRKEEENEGLSDDDSEESENDAVEESSESENENKENQGENRKPRLKISVGFDWNTTKDEEIARAEGAATDTDDEDDADEVDESAQVARKKSKRAKRAAKKAEEEFLYKTEQALLNQDKGPQTTDEFDRVLLSTPNDSLLWLQYMAFYLHLTEIDKARAVAERALKSISFREESEKFNVWMGLLNLENSYGTHDSLVDVFTRALEQNEPKNVFEQLANIYIKSNKFELAEQLYQTMVKRFKTSKKVWTDYGAFLMERGELQTARNLLQRSLKSLEKRKHVETITRFAMLEFKHGEPERGGTLLDNILTSYPKRTDIWSMYVDMLIRSSDIAGARRLFEREVTLKLSSRKMKFVFKKFLEFEKKHGEERTVANVKKMAEDFVREKTG